MKVVRIGRGSDNDVCIHDPLVTRICHCQIIQDDNGRFRLIDTMSKNGTYVNGIRCRGEVQLNKTDIIRIGNTTLPWRTYFLPGEINMEPVAPITPSPVINIPSEINIKEDIVSSDVARRGDDFGVKFFRNLGDKMGNILGTTLGCLASIIIVAVICIIIGIIASLQ